MAEPKDKSLQDTTVPVAPKAPVADKSLQDASKKKDKSIKVGDEVVVKAEDYEGGLTSKVYEVYDDSVEILSPSGEKKTVSLTAVEKVA